jgi:Ca2+-binding EF-hand superfamily protein
MGNKSSSPKGVLPKKDLALYSKSGFSEKEIQALYGQFLSLATTGHLTQSEFQAALGFKGRETSLFLERVFKQMDVDHDGKL